MNRVIKNGTSVVDFAKDPRPLGPLARSFTRRVVASALVLLSLPGPVAHSAKPSKPNFVVIFTDDQGYQDLGCFGSPDIRTPRLDQMVKQGMKFKSFCHSFVPRHRPCMTDRRMDGMSIAGLRSHSARHPGRDVTSTVAKEHDQKE